MTATDSSTKLRILELLASNVPPANVAQAVGCSPSYISQLLTDEDFVAELSSRRVAATESDIHFDKSLNSLEDLLVERLHLMLPTIIDPMKAVRALKDISSVRRRAEASALPTTAPQLTVTIDLPQAAQARIDMQLSEQRQVIAIEGRSMQTLPSRNLQDSLAARAKAQSAMLMIRESKKSIIDEI